MTLHQLLGALWLLGAVVVAWLAYRDTVAADAEYDAIERPLRPLTDVEARRIMRCIFPENPKFWPKPSPVALRLSAENDAEAADAVYSLWCERERAL